MLNEQTRIIEKMRDELRHAADQQDAEQRANAAFEVFILVLVVAIAAVLVWMGLRDFPAAWVA